MTESTTTEQSKSEPLDTGMAASPTEPSKPATFVENLMLLGKNIYFLSTISLTLGICIGMMGYVNAKEPLEGLPIEDIEAFGDVFDRVKRHYVEEVDDKTLLNNAIKGMLSELDPHSAYLDPDAYDDLRVSTTGKFGGLGIVVSMEDGYVKVVSPIDDTPAAKAGVKSGDLIVKLDEKNVYGMTLSDAVDIMRGEIGTDIKLTIVREGESQALEIELTRDEIKVESVKHRNLEDGYGYLRIANFQINTGGDLKKALETLQKENDELKGLVLDLRDNPGGVLDASIDVSSLFLKSGEVVSIKGRNKASEKRFNATKGDATNGIPIVVLVNGGSASASEIVAGALQDHKRAIIMGTTTFGKGSVQTVVRMSKGRALKLTTSRYYTPSGRSIQAEGIEPDIEVEMAKLTTLRKGSQYRKEADLDGHLEGAKEKALSSQEKLKASFKDEEDKKEEEKPLSETDFQLYQALTLLKSINIVNSLK